MGIANSPFRTLLSVSGSPPRRTRRPSKPNLWQQGRKKTTFRKLGWIHQLQTTTPAKQNNTHTIHA